MSRLQIFDIPSPDKHQSTQVAKRIYKMILDESPSLKLKFTGDLNDSVINLVAELSPRKMRLAIEIALGKAALAKRKNLICKDFTIEQKKDKLKIGFM